MKNTKELVKHQLLSMNDKLIDGLKLYHIDLKTTAPSSTNHNIEGNEAKYRSQNRQVPLVGVPQRKFMAKDLSS